MSKNDLITVYCFGQEIGRLGFDENRGISYFQYSESFLESGKMKNLFPPQMGIIQRISQTQVFRGYTSNSFRSLPPMIADSLPDMFGNIIFKEWLESTRSDFAKITVLEQLAYVANRGMGALEFRPKKEIPKNATIVIDDIVEVLKKVMDTKERTAAINLDHESLLTVFKIGSSAGGARPKILISEHKKHGKIIPGDINYSDDYNHYLVKLNLDEVPYNRELIEYSYYLSATKAGIEMMDSKMIEEKHFATKRFDRVNGKKKHVLTITGLTGWDYTDTTSPQTSYENLFRLLPFLHIPHAESVQLFKRMVFNIIFCNKDDHFKNQSLIYDDLQDSWNLAPAYDITYSLNPLINFKKSYRVLSVNGKKNDITFADVQAVANQFTIKNYRQIILEIQSAIPFWIEKAVELGIPELIIKRIKNDFILLIQE
ncbi:type II toxin-antitoxin system HipA family toxin [Algoriphagus aquimarinus]|uniref:type II toxin-antitoxin system HipA family toxin n=1 Tax=Algoriphagus aquimarinus TaxID=237018 RepID=UPI0030DD8C15